MLVIYQKSSSWEKFAVTVQSYKKHDWASLRKIWDEKKILITTLEDEMKKFSHN
jgi:hypothetical protein